MWTHTHTSLRAAGVHTQVRQELRLMQEVHQLIPACYIIADEADMFTGQARQKKLSKCPGAVRHCG